MDTKPLESPFQLVRAFITNLDLKNSFVNYDENIPGQKTIDAAFEIVNDKLFPEKNYYMGIVDLYLNITSNINERAYVFKMTYRGLFTASSSLTQDIFNQRLRINGVAALYTMARAAITSISTQVFGGGAIVLPMVNVVGLHEITHNTPNNEASDKTE